MTIVFAIQDDLCKVKTINDLADVLGQGPLRGVLMGEVLESRQTPWR